MVLIRKGIWPLFRLAPGGTLDQAESCCQEQTQGSRPRSIDIHGQSDEVELLDWMYQSRTQPEWSQW